LRDFTRVCTQQRRDGRSMTEKKFILEYRVYFDRAESILCESGAMHRLLASERDSRNNHVDDDATRFARLHHGNTEQYASAG
jgi:hypothetical protein